MRVFDVMKRASWHQFQVLTKRSQRLMELSDELESPDNAWTGVSVETSEYLYRLDHLQVTGAKVKFLSLELLLGPLLDMNLTDIDWTIVGGESEPGALLIKKEWMIDNRDQCFLGRVPFFFK